jgi:hypothetical protein
MYVRAFQPGGTHDLFYTDPTIVQAFKNYVSQVVPRFANSSTVLAWELANDPRCNSTLPASPQCNTQTITKWVADLGLYYSPSIVNKSLNLLKSGLCQAIRSPSSCYCRVMHLLCVVISLSNRSHLAGTAASTVWAAPSYSLHIEKRNETSRLRDQPSTARSASIPKISPASPP